MKRRSFFGALAAGAAGLVAGSATAEPRGVELDTSNPERFNAVAELIVESTKPPTAAPTSSVYLWQENGALWSRAPGGEPFRVSDV